MKRVVLALGLLVAPNAWAAPITVPPLKLCMNNLTGAIIAKKACKGSETTITGQVLQSFAGVGIQGVPGAQGPQGPQGPAGSSGTFDPAKCTPRSNATAGVTLVKARATCAAGEFVQTHGVQVNYGAVDIVQTALLFSPGAPVAGAVEYTVGVNIPSDPTVFSVQTDLVCCRP